MHHSECNVQLITLVLVDRFVQWTRPVLSGLIAASRTSRWQIRHRPVERASPCKRRVPHHERPRVYCSTTAAPKSANWRTKNYGPLYPHEFIRQVTKNRSSCLQNLSR